MCYMILLSTDSDEDLSKHNVELVQYTRDMPGLAEEAYVKYPNQWFVESRHGCSCGFRHLHVSSIDIGFGLPEDWFPEESDDIESTLIFVNTVKELLALEAKVDCIDAWDNQDDSCDLSGIINVDLNSMKEGVFRFYENHHFVFEAELNK